MEEAQELYCHGCGRYVRFKLDLSINGKYRLRCPNCNHDHYRVVRNGRITDTRYAQGLSQRKWVRVAVTSVSATSAYSGSGYGTMGSLWSVFARDSWSNSTSTTSF